MKTFVEYVQNSLEENIGLINLSVNRYKKNMKFKNTKNYLSYCFKQAIEYAHLQNHSTITTMPLIQFYSILNLVKTFAIIKQNDRNITLTNIEKQFNSHGASSKNRDDVKINAKGTFKEFKKCFDRERNNDEEKEYSLKILYKRLPDLHEYLPLVFKSENTDYHKVYYCQDYMYMTGDMNSAYFFDWLVMKQDLYAANLEKTKKLEIKGQLSNEMVIVSKINQKESLSEFIQFDCENNLYIDSNQNEINELLAIYLIFLKYSSLVRYKPKVWNEKINSDELLIIEKILHLIFKRFWALIAKELQKRESILI